MDPRLTLLLLGFSVPSSSLLRQFHYVNLKMTWAQAQSYCRHRYTDLATISSMEHISRLSRPALETAAAWIGLSDDPQSWRDNMGSDLNSWRWSATGETSSNGFHNWGVGEPNNVQTEECAAMIATGDWMDFSCAYWRSFVCFTRTHTNVTNYVFIADQLTWIGARAYCRTHYTDLPTIENAEVNHKVYSTKPYASEVWIGLYRISWAWSDKSVSSFRNWAPGEPNDSVWFCAAENAEHKWLDADCNSQFTFLCHEDPEVKKTRMLVLKMQTLGDLTDPAVSEQILRQLGTELESRGRTDIRLQWKVQFSPVRRK